jgi:hypothetical protein
MHSFEPSNPVVWARLRLTGALGRLQTPSEGLCDCRTSNNEFPSNFRIADAAPMENKLDYGRRRVTAAAVTTPFKVFSAASLQ